MEMPPKYEQKLKMAIPLDQQPGSLSDCMGEGCPDDLTIHPMADALAQAKPKQYGKSAR